jgi:hypothetical protein
MEKSRLQIEFWSDASQVIERPELNEIGTLALKPGLLTAANIRKARFNVFGRRNIN